MADNPTSKLVGQNYTTPDLVAKVTGKAKYSEDELFEIVVSASLGASMRRLDAGMRALREATGEKREGKT